MPAVPAFIAFVVIVAGILGLGAFFLWSSTQRIPEETGRSPIYVDRGGGRFGLTNFTVPFVRVAVYPDLIVIRHREIFLVRPTDISGLRVYSGVLKRGVQLEHRNPSLPDPLIIWSSAPEELAAAIRPLLAPSTGPPSSSSKPVTAG